MRVLKAALPHHTGTMVARCDPNRLHPDVVKFAFDGDGVLCAWAEATEFWVEPLLDLPELRNVYLCRFEAISTGDDVPEGLVHIESAISMSGMLWHIYTEGTWRFVP